MRAQGCDLPKPLVALGDEPLLLRQTRALLEAGAERVVAVVNSETARIIKQRSIEIPAPLMLVVRDTANSMETLFEIGRYAQSSWLLAATVDSVLPQGALKRFLERSLTLCQKAHRACDGTLGVTRWRGDDRALFVEVARRGKILKIGAPSGDLVTAGVYFLPRRVFDFSSRARSAKLAALREFLGRLVDWGFRLGAIELDGVIDIDLAQDLEAARRMLGLAVC